MFKHRRQTCHHKPHSRNNPHPSQNGNFHKHTAGQPSYEQDFHEHEACQNCPYKRSFYEHFHYKHNEDGFHGHHHGSHHSHSEHSEGAKRLEDGSLQCLCCPNKCMMTVSEDGSVSGNHCPKGAEAARHIMVN